MRIRRSLVLTKAKKFQLEHSYTVNDLLNTRGVYLIYVLKGGGRLIDTRRLLEGGVYLLSKETHSNHNRNKLTALLNSNNFHTTFAERTLINKLLIDEVVYMLFILGKTLSVMEKKNFWDLCNKRPLLGASIREGRLIERGV